MIGLQQDLEIISMDSKRERHHTWRLISLSCCVAPPLLFSEMPHPTALTSVPALVLAGLVLSVMGVMLDLPLSLTICAGFCKRTREKEG